MTAMSQMQAFGPVLVTGASGFVGSAIANALRRDGYRVRVMVRPSSPRINIDPRDEIAVCDIRDRTAVAEAMRGVRYLIHAAADYRLWAPSPDEIMQTNVDGTRVVMEEAARAGLERIVYTSSVATFDISGPVPADETRALPLEKAVGAYKRSKVIAERLVVDLAQTHGLPVVVTNPSTPIGPRDVRPTPTGRIVVEAAAGRMPAFVDTGLNFVHVDDVANGHIAALHRGRVGERYILGGENLTLRQVLTDIAEIVGRKPPRVKLPRLAVYPFAVGAELLARLSGSEPFATVDGLRMSRHYMHFDDGKARRELGYTSRPYREALSDAIDWFAKAGYLPQTVRARAAAL
ncbi:MAG: NAD-dependent epimerase/dehydratase family protein [Alphaproteobacteria bacterium]|nr:NAD-dependent epimerase/dehydratase family protein [Alphaproteobacteria bacterium]